MPDPKRNAISLNANGLNAISLSVPGTRLQDPPLPRLLAPTTRGTELRGEDPFLPTGFLKVERGFDLSGPSRDIGGTDLNPLDLPPDQVVVLEMVEGITVITSAGNLAATLQQIGEESLLGLEDRGLAGAASRSSSASQLITRLFSLDLGSDALIEEAKAKALAWAKQRLGEKVKEKLGEVAELGVSWLGTKALMWAIEKRLRVSPGLYRWSGRSRDPSEVFGAADPKLAQEALQGPLLVFIHGTGSNGAGSFGDLQETSEEDWRALRATYGERIYTFEHYTFSESPIDNALALARILPAGARIHLVTHSRGGLVGDLLCLRQMDDDLIDAFHSGSAPCTADDPGRRESLEREGERAYAEQREQLRELRTLLGREHGFRIERYVRVAAPARGTLLISGNFDAFLSALLTLLGTVPYLAGNPIYSCVKRVVLEIARHRTDPRLVPGIEAMLPEAPLGRFLAMATPAEGLQLAVIAGDIEGGHLLKRLGVLFTDFVFFEGVNNDLVVDTDSMGAGIARPGNAHQLFEQGPRVSHFNYFANASSRGALRRWLTERNPTSIAGFHPVSGLIDEGSLDTDRADERSLRSSAGIDGATEQTLPLVVVLPDCMASHLWREAGRDRLWFDPGSLALGGLEKISSGNAADRSIKAEKLFSLYYGELCKSLIGSHRVVRFAYDWRRPLQETAVELAIHLKALLQETAASGQPVRLLAHGMGGLVVRALVKTEESLWNELMDRSGARFVMLGTPNQGSHQMVETLLGKSDLIRKLTRIDSQHSMQQILNIMAGFPGLLQLLPKPGFREAGDVQQRDDYFLAGVWQELKQLNHDRWAGDGIAATPSEAVLAQSRWLWDQESPELPEQHKQKVIYVYGQASMTPCGLLEQNDRLKMLGTPAGDGAVTWASGPIPGIGSFYVMPVEHAALCNSAAHFAAIIDLLATGSTEPARLKAVNIMPTLRSAMAPVVYDAGPIPYPTEEEVALSLLGGRKRQPLQARPAPCLQVCCKAMDLRFVTEPVLVGHYLQDAISGPEALIDRELVDRELSMRHRLGLYAGAQGTATVVLLTNNDEERRRGKTRGAVVIGLGSYGELSAVTLTEAVRVGTLRYLLQMVDRQSGDAPEAIEAPLSALLLGYNSTTNISVEDSVAALVRGVLAANHQFSEARPDRPDIPVRITRLEIVELYLDIAATAARALVRVAEQINRDSARYGMRVEADRELRQGNGFSQRLDASQGVAYWPRLEVTDADQRQECLSPPEGTEPLAAKPRRAFAERLRFAYLGQRARSETIQHQRQPGLVESLVESSIRQSTYVEDLSRTLFQLLVPHDFKNQARQMDRMVLVLDGYTANLPWELLLADDKPLALSTRMVRQLQSPRYRTQVRQTLEKRAYVIGNPSTEGFNKVFADGLTRKAPEALDGLDGAANEAQTVVNVLRQYGYDCEEAIGGEKAVDIINKLYRSLYRIVHIAAHGVYDEKTRDGGSRSGVVLSDGLLITAAEIGAMETVPDLVFLNCCHLAKADARPVAFNRLAYSISRELIEMGVRAVVAAGWAVDDGAARVFAEEFYSQILRNRPFGDAVFAARSRTHEEFPSLNTWGAYQAYGDPGFVIDPLRDRADSEAVEGWKPVTKEELMQRLRELATKAAGGDPTSTEGSRELAGAVDMALQSCPDEWKSLAAVRFALGEVYAELGDAYFDKAREQYLAAIRLEDRSGGVPIRAIEQLANLESRTGHTTANAVLINTAKGRLEGLVELASTTLDPAEPNNGTESPAGSNPERAALLGSAYKRLAAVQARNLRQDHDQDQNKDGGDVLLALEQAIDWYAKAGTQPYPVLNLLALEAVRDFGIEAKPASLERVRECSQQARAAWRANPDFWNAVMPADALLTECLLDSSLGSGGKAGETSFTKVQKIYADALANVPGTRRELDSVEQHLRILQVLFKAQGHLKPRLAGRARLIAKRLDLLAQQILGPTADQGATAGSAAGTSDGTGGEDDSEIVKIQ
jgi:CHAT domain-containing protein/pimeloyl-ACP methyl ester carboxylesterase